MLNEEIRDLLDPEAVVFDDPAYDNSIIGVSSEGAVVYNYDLMVEECMMDDKCTEEEAIEWIDYNTVRALPYAHSLGTPPVILYPIYK